MDTCNKIVLKPANYLVNPVPGLYSSGGRERPPTTTTRTAADGSTDRTRITFLTTFPRRPTLLVVHVSSVLRLSSPGAFAIALSSSSPPPSLSPPRAVAAARARARRVAPILLEQLREPVFFILLYAMYGNCFSLRLTNKLRTIIWCLEFLRSLNRSRASIINDRR
jgi:hypothetical protein